MKLKLDHGAFDSCPGYNVWLDEQSAAINVAGFQPRPSQVLFTMSPDTYEATLADFALQREDDLKSTVFADYPSPIAHYFYRFENGCDSDLQRLFTLRDTWEAVVDVVHAVVVGEARFLGMQLSASMSFGDLLTESVAQRLLNVERIMGMAAEQAIVPGLSGIVSSDTLTTMRELNQVRNAFSHGAMPSEKQAGALVGECYEDVIDVLDSLRGLADVRVLLYKGQAGSKLRCEDFRGHALTRTIRSYDVTADQVVSSQRFLQPGQVLAFTNGRLFGLRPMLHYHEDQSGHTTRLCAFRKTKGIEPNREVEFSIVGDASLCVVSRTLFRDDMNELRSLFGLGSE